MSEKTLLKKVNSLKELEIQKKSIEKQMAVLQEEIKKELEARGSEEAAIGDWTVRFKAVMSNKFNSKAFAADHPILYKKIYGSCADHEIHRTVNAHSYKGSHSSRE